MVISILAALYVEFLFLQRMTPAFNRQIGLGLLLIGGVGVLITTLFSQRTISLLAASIMFWMQIIVSLVSVLLAFGLYRSLVPV